jgi:hypothetical protein
MGVNEFGQPVYVHALPPAELRRPDNWSLIDTTPPSGIFFTIACKVSARAVANPA